MTIYRYNDANQLIESQTSEGLTTYEFDPNGNQVKKTMNDTITRWGYDYENRLLSYDDPVNSGQYWYDISGRRIKKTSTVAVFNAGGSGTASDKIGVGNGKGQGINNGQGIDNATENQYTLVTETERYIYDGANVVADVTDEGITAEYITPFLDQNLMMEKAGSIYYYMQDGLGSVRNIIDSIEKTQNMYDYNAFGEPLNWTESIDNRYTYTSREFDEESASYYYRARQYFPIFGRFNRRDPLGYVDSVGLYTYVRSNPVNRIDPFGLRDWGPLGGNCCNKSKGIEWALVGEGKWERLNPGQCTGFWTDCDGMTCGGGFYQIKNLETGSCVTPRKDCPAAACRRWTPTHTTRKNAKAPTQRGSKEGDTPPGYEYDES